MVWFDYQSTLTCPGGGGAPGRALDADPPPPSPPSLTAQSTLYIDSGAPQPRRGHMRLMHIAELLD